MHRKQPQPRLLKRKAKPPATGMVIGYARVSREDQILDMQLTALKAAGAQKIFIEKISAASSRRPAYDLMMKFIEPGDTLVFYAYNRLCRNVKQLLTLIDQFKAEGIGMRSTTEANINPFTSTGRMMATVVGAVDEHERERLRERTRDGMQEQKRQGKTFGRQRIVTPPVKARMQRMRDRGVKPKDIGRHFRVKPSTVYANTTAKS